MNPAEIPIATGNPLEADVLKKLGWEDNIAFENKVFGGTIPKEYIPRSNTAAVWPPKPAYWLTTR